MRNCDRCIKLPGYPSDRASERYERHNEYRKSKGLKQIPFFNWIFNEEDNAMDYANIGDLIRKKGEQNYAIVKGYDTDRYDNYFCRLVLSWPDSSTSTILIGDEVYERMRLPKEAIDAILKANECCSDSLKEKCPFRNEYKDPVPPCMKDGELD